MMALKAAAESSQAWQDGIEQYPRDTCAPKILIIAGWGQ